MVGEYRFDKYYTESSVITGSCALTRCGLTSCNAEHLDLQTTIQSLDGLKFVPCNFFYCADIDYAYEVSESPTNPVLLQPSKERALVECIKHLDWCDEGILIEALKSYLLWFRDDEKLYVCAEHFNVGRDTIDYWINEALTDEDV